MRMVYQDGNWVNDDPKRECLPPSHTFFVTRDSVPLLSEWVLGVRTRCRACALQSQKLFSFFFSIRGTSVPQVVSRVSRKRGWGISSQQEWQVFKKGRVKTWMRNTAEIRFETWTQYKRHNTSRERTENLKQQVIASSFLFSSVNYCQDCSCFEKVSFPPVFLTAQMKQ